MKKEGERTPYTPTLTHSFLFSASVSPHLSPPFTCKNRRTRGMQFYLAPVLVVF